VHASIEDDLRDGCDPRSGLLAFARRVAALAFSSSEYALIRAPVGARGRRVRGSVRNAPKELFVERIARFVAQGVLGPAEPWRVAEHFIALTFLLALDLLDTFDAAVDGAWNELDELLVDGVDAFLRAYARAGRAAR
jgi:TetR/AcrR family transcriptional repressor of mexJK operon